jgi:hypothetical protein
MFGAENLSILAQIFAILLPYIQAWLAAQMANPAPVIPVPVNQSISSLLATLKL